MPAGMQVFNNHNTIQITSESPSFSLRQKIDVMEPGQVIHTVAGQVVTRRVEFTVWAENPVMAYTAADSHVAYAKIQNQGGNQWLVSVYCDNTYNVGATIYIFDTVVTAPGRFGFEVYTAQGRLGFSTSGKPMKVMYIGRADMASSSSVRVPGFRRWACVAARAAQGRQLSVGSKIRGFHNSGYANSAEGTIVQFAGRAIQIPTTDSSKVFNQSGLYAMIDVTGY